MDRLYYPRPLAFVEELGRLSWSRARIVADPARHAASHLHTLEVGGIPALRRTHGPGAPQDTYDETVSALGYDPLETFDLLALAGLS
jgi:hypothetical protein